MKLITDQRTDASFTDPNRPSKAGDINIESYQECLAYVDTLMMAAHALQSNIDVLEAVTAESARRRMKVSTPSHALDYEIFESGVSNVLRELRSTRAHIELIRNRLDQSFVAVRLQFSFRKVLR